MAEKKKSVTAKKADVEKVVAPKAKSTVKTVSDLANQAMTAIKKAVTKKETATPEKVPAKKKAEVTEKAAPKVAAKVATKSTSKTAAKAVAPEIEKAPAKAATKSKSTASKADVTHSFNPEYLVLMQKDPNWMQAFWDVNDRRVQKAVKGGNKLVLRLYDVAADLTLRKRRARQFRDFTVPADARSWYIQNTLQNSAFTVSLGSVDATGEFSPILESGQVQAFGSNGQFLNTQDGLFIRASLGGVGPDGFGSSQLGLSSQMSLPWTSSLSGSSAAPSSWSSSASTASWNVAPAWAAQDKGKDFFLWVKTRLIVYGGTRPDAHLQVRGEHFPLNPDGTFSFEQDLPDSTQIIPVFATDKDGDFPTTIVPVVIKRTE